MAGEQLDSYPTEPILLSVDPGASLKQLDAALDKVSHNRPRSIAAT